MANQGRGRQESETIIPPEAAILTALLLGSGLLALFLVTILNIKGPLWSLVWFALFEVILLTLGWVVAKLLPNNHKGGD